MFPIRSFSGPYFPAFGNAGKYGPEKAPYLDTFHTVNFLTETRSNSLQTSYSTTSKKCAIGNATLMRAFKFSYCKITNQLKVPYKVTNVSLFIITKNDQLRVYRVAIIHQHEQTRSLIATT